MLIIILLSLLIVSIIMIIREIRRIKEEKASAEMRYKISTFKRESNEGKCIR